MCLFLTNLEILIVTIVLMTITDDLQDFSQSSWIVAAYLLEYVDQITYESFELQLLTT